MKNWNIKDILIIILLFLIVIGGFQYFSNNKKWNNKYNSEIKLREALSDSVKFFETKNNELVAEKRTIQGNLNDLFKDNVNLNKNQEALLNTVKRLNKEWNKEKEIWAAARIQYETLIDSMDNVIANAASIDTLNNTVSFIQTDTAAHFIYDLDVLGVRPFPKYEIPQLKFNKIDFPNTQTITFQFNKNERKDYPISFSVINTNKYYKVYDVDSYTIPGIQKEIVNPNGFQKVWKWIKINGKYILVGVAGFAVGATVSGTN